MKAVPFYEGGDLEDLKVEEVNVDDLKPYDRNANIHTDEQIDQIAASIEEFGFLDPVGVWEDADGALAIVEGHGRVLAAKRLGMPTIPIIRLDRLSDEQRRAYALVHNQLTRNSQFDFGILEDELCDLDFDWDILGFDDWFPKTGGKPDNTGELDIEEFSEDKFEVTCPRCGMRFNP